MTRGTNAAIVAGTLDRVNNVVRKVSRSIKRPRLANDNHEETRGRMGNGESSSTSRMNKDKELPPIPSSGLGDNYEFISRIAGFLDPDYDRETLLSLTVTRKAFRSIGEAQLYSSLGYTLTSPSQFRQLYNFLTKVRPDVLQYIRRLNITNSVQSIHDYDSLHKLSLLIPRLIHLTELVYLSPVRMSAALILTGCQHLKLIVLEWSSVPEDESVLADLLRSQSIIHRLKVNWTGSPLMLQNDAAPVMQTLVGTTKSVLAFGARPMLQLHWTIGDEPEEELRKTWLYVKKTRKMSVRINPDHINRLRAVSPLLLRLTILEIISSNIDVDTLITILAPLNAHPEFRMLILSLPSSTSEGVFSEDCLFTWSGIQNVIRIIMQHNSSLHKLYIQRPPLPIPGGRRGRGKCYDAYENGPTWNTGVFQVGSSGAVDPAERPLVVSAKEVHRWNHTFTPPPPPLPMRVFDTQSLFILLPTSASQLHWNIAPGDSEGEMVMASMRLRLLRELTVVVDDLGRLECAVSTGGLSGLRVMEVVTSDKVNVDILNVVLAKLYGKEAELHTLILTFLFPSNTSPDLNIHSAKQIMQRNPKLQNLFIQRPGGRYYDWYKNGPEYAPDVGDADRMNGKDADDAAPAPAVVLDEEVFVWKGV